MDRLTLSAYKLYCGDCRELAITDRIDLLLTDPPYGVGYKHNNKDRKRSVIASANNYPDVYDDDKPFDPRFIIERYHPATKIVLWGANYFAGELPQSPSWLVWDKLNGLQSKREIGFNDSADVELAWTNCGGPARLIPHRWMGIMKEGQEHNEKRLHPTQKPVLLMQRIIEQYTKPGDTVADFYMGAGSTGVAAIKTGRNFIGIEIVPEYVEIARRRIEECLATLTESKMRELVSI